MNQIVRLTKLTIVKDTTDGVYIYYTNTDLHTTRNLYLHSSVLGSSDTLSNFNMDTLIKNKVLEQITTNSSSTQVWLGLFI